MQKIIYLALFLGLLIGLLFGYLYGRRVAIYCHENIALVNYQGEYYAVRGLTACEINSK